MAWIVVETVLSQVPHRVHQLVGVRWADQISGAGCPRHCHTPCSLSLSAAQFAYDYAYMIPSQHWNPSQNGALPGQPGFAAE